MPYRKEIFTAPGIREEKKYHTYRLGGKHTRAANYQKTEEAVQKGNSRRAKEKLYRLMVTNFKRDDYRIDLTYAEPAPDPKTALERIRKFIRQLRSQYRKKKEELKYIYVTEYRGHRIHHHVLINAVEGIGRKEIGELWPWAKLNYRSFRLFDGGVEDCQRLAWYLLKETDKSIRDPDSIQKLRWCASKNLKQPKIRKQTIYSRHWKEKPKVPKGYQLAEMENGYTTDGYPFQFYRLIRIAKEEKEQVRPVLEKKKTVKQEIKPAMTERGRP